MRKHHLFAVKISISEHLFSKPLNETKAYFREGIMTNSIFLNKFDSLWNFMDITPYTNIGDREIIAGRIVRARDEEAMTIDTSVSSPSKNNIVLNKNNVENVARWSNFIFDMKTEILIFEERKAKISKNQFIEAFMDLVKINAPALGELKYEFLPAATDLKRELSTLETIYYAKFNLIPANWDNDDDFNELDEELKNLRTSEATHEYKSRGQGLNPKSKLITKPVNMSLGGYGNFDIRGTDANGIEKQVNSKQDLLYETVESGEDVIDDFTRRYLLFLRKALDQHLGAANNE